MSAEPNRKVDEVSVRKSERDLVEVQNGGNQNEEKDRRGGDGLQRPPDERRRLKPNPRLSNPPKRVWGEQVAAGWPLCLAKVCGEAIRGLIPRKPDTFEKLRWMI